jgi:predicted ester cyclase
MSSENRSLVTRYFEEICNGRKLNVADEIFAAAHRYHDPSSPGIGTGPDGMKQLVSVYQNAFPDAHWTIDEMLESGDRVITRWTGSGTHHGDLAGLAPTGRPVNVTGIWIQRIAGGKIVESWNQWDTLGMLTQLGAVPAFGKAGAAR